MPDGSTTPATALSGWELRKRPMCALWWAGLPLVAQRLSAGLSAVTLDGQFLAAWPNVGALAPWLALLAGITGGALHPGYDQIFYESALVLGALVLCGALSGQLGLLFAVGFALGEALLGAVTPPGAPSWLASPLRAGVPLLIQFIAVGVLGAMLAPMAKGMAMQVPLPRALTGVRRFAVLAALQAVAAGLISWGWITAAPVLLQPRTAWIGADSPERAVSAAAELAIPIALLAVLATAIRMVLQYRTAFDKRLTPWLDRLQAMRDSVPAGTPLLDRIPPGPMLALQAGFATLMLAGMMQGWIDAIVSLALLSVVQALRSGLLPGLGGWRTIAEKVPVLIRLVAGTALLALVGPSLLWFFFENAGGLRPMLFITLLSVVLFLLLLPGPGPNPAKAKRS